MGMKGVARELLIGEDTSPVGVGSWHDFMYDGQRPPPDGSEPGRALSECEFNPFDGI